MADLMNSDVFLAFSTYAAIVILKMMFMSPLTGYFRITRKVQLVFKNSETSDWFILHYVEINFEHWKMQEL